MSVVSNSETVTVVPLGYKPESLELLQATSDAARIKLEY
jgi:hypothetical protein